MMLAGVDTVQSVGLEMLPSFQVPIPAASSDSRVCSGQDHDCLPCQPVHAHDAKDSLPLLLPAVVSEYCMEFLHGKIFTVLLIYILASFSEPRLSFCRLQYG